MNKQGEGYEGEIQELLGQWKKITGTRTPGFMENRIPISINIIAESMKTNTNGLPNKVKKESFEARLDAILEGLDPKDFKKQDETPTVEVSKLDDTEDEEYYENEEFEDEI